MRYRFEHKKAQRVVWIAKTIHSCSTTLSLNSTMNTLMATIEMFRPAFTAPTYANFRYLTLAWLTCGRAKISELVRAGRHMAGLLPKQEGTPKHFSVFYRFFSRARWSLDTLGRMLANAFKPRLSDEVTVLVDDTIFRRTGPRMLGAGLHFDALRSTYSGKEGRRTRYAFGLKFVILAIWVPVGFMKSGGIAVPILFRLYRSPKTCSEDEHTKFTVLAADMINLLEAWWPDRQILVAGDRDYSSQTVLRRLAETTEAVGRLPMDAALYDPNVEQTPGPGRPRKWGTRLMSPRQLARDETRPWKLARLYMYGQQVVLWVKTMQAQWKRAGADRTLTVVLTRDPEGRLDDACFFRTRSECSIREVLIPMSQRWTLESGCRDCKQHLRLEEVQNGFARGQHRADTTQPGPQADPTRAPRASRRTIPIGMLCYGIVVLWYLDHGKPLVDIAWARYLAPWYTHKATISFGDMLDAFRRQMEHEGFWNTRPNDGVGEKTIEHLAAQPPPGPFGPRKAGDMSNHKDTCAGPHTFSKAISA